MLSDESWPGFWQPLLSVAVRNEWSVTGHGQTVGNPKVRSLRLRAPTSANTRREHARATPRETTVCPSLTLWPGTAAPRRTLVSAIRHGDSSLRAAYPQGRADR
jgi:hypothetical protein